MSNVTHDDMKNHWLLCAEVIAAAERLVEDARANGGVDWATSSTRPEKVALAKAVGALQADSRRMGGDGEPACYLLGEVAPCRDCGEPCEGARMQCPQCWELTEQLPWGKRHE